ncbi:DUF3006 family protein [Cytobacillus solani]|uniref:DUF3006 domain-containing protein n=1 Tax=Cytobacillus solani TaxID=1637975 RepID=A0A0Q3QPH9_9BACI|nr:DUF3006 family protein [Cytobacillus solani]KOP83041.1 hypothetical protein AMS60_11525 [Bacillus sp. FJAT-21945]KQL20065.1 hypothetical protein AN957_16835 [Cytobacillus solani]USK53315.1 DUF3006 domain-containing protein [Cytobacillus solani]
MKGYFDRIEDQQLAVILVEEINEQFVIKQAKLPFGSKPGMWFDLTIKDRDLISIQHSNQTSFSEKQNTNDLMEKIRLKSKGSKYKQ